MSRWFSAALLATVLPIADCSSSSTNDSSSGGAGSGGNAGSAGSGAKPPFDASADSDSDAASDAAIDYSAVVLADGPIAYYRFDELAGPVASDQTGGNDGTYTPFSVAFAAPGAVAGNAAIDLLADGYVQFPGPQFGFATLAPFTFEGWFSPNVVDDTVRTILIRYDGTDGYLLDHSSSQGLRFSRYASAGNAKVTGAPLVVQKYTHVVVTYDGGELCLYRDGQKESCTPTSLAIGTSGNALRVSGNTNSEYLGLADELAIYNQALSAERVLAHYQARGID